MAKKIDRNPKGTEPRAANPVGAPNAATAAPPTAPTPAGAESFAALGDDIIRELLAANEAKLLALPGFKAPQSREEAVALLVAAGIEAPAPGATAGSETIDRPLDLTVGADGEYQLPPGTEPLTETQMQAMAGQITDVIPGVQVTLPYKENAGYTPRNPDLTLSGRQATALSYLLAGLRAAGAKLPAGTPVKSHSHAIAWVLEHVAEAAELPNPK
jgi:hypothetical protein